MKADHTIACRSDLLKQFDLPFLAHSFLPGDCRQRPNYCSPMPEMTEDEINTFLDEPGHLLRIGTVDADGLPLVVPIWFIRDGPRLLFTPRAKSSWLAHIRANPRACCTIDESASPMRKVVARGPVEVVHDIGNDDAWRDIYRSITMRYVPESFGEAYLTDTHDEPRALLAMAMDTPATRTWRMPYKESEDRLAVWSKLYYHDGR